MSGGNSAARARLAAGNAHAQSGDLQSAIREYREAFGLDPDWPGAVYNLGLMLKRTGDLAEAARAFHTAWMLDRSVPHAGRQCVATVAAWIRADPSVPEMAPVALDAPPPTVSIVVCSIDAAKSAHVEALYHRLFAAVPHELIMIRDARSLAEAYNRAVAATRADVVILSHDDIDVLAPDFAARVLRHLERFDAVGIAGAVSATGPAHTWSGHPHLRGWVTHRAPGEAAWRADVLDPRPVAEGIAVLDGVLLAARRGIFATVPFDAATFDGFHLYDVDWSYRAGRAGLRLGVAGDLLLVHQSQGSYDDRWQLYADRFTARHALPPAPPPAEGVYYEAVLESPEQVRAFYARLAGLSGIS